MKRLRSPQIFCTLANSVQHHCSLTNIILAQYISQRVADFRWSSSRSCL